MNSQWLMYEAGALSKSLARSRVCPIIFGMSQTDVSGPLQQFQCTEFNQNDIRKLIKTINEAAGDDKLDDSTLAIIFETWWPHLQERVLEIQRKLRGPKETRSPVRNTRDVLDEILELTRMNARDKTRQTPRVDVGLFIKLMEAHIKLIRGILIRNSHSKLQSDFNVIMDCLDSILVNLDHRSNTLLRVHQDLRKIASLQVIESEDFDVLVDDLRS